MVDISMSSAWVLWTLEVSLVITKGKKNPQKVDLENSKVPFYSKIVLKTPPVTRFSYNTNLKKAQNSRYRRIPCIGNLGFKIIQGRLLIEDLRYTFSVLSALNQQDLNCQFFGFNLMKILWKHHPDIKNHLHPHAMRT